MKLIKALVLLSSFLLTSCGGESKKACSFSCEIELLIVKTEYKDSKFVFN